MAVDTTQSWQEHTSDGSTAYFSFNFNYDTTRPGTIVVGKRTADNTYTVVNASNYQLIPNASGDGGQVRFIQNPSGNQIVDDIPPAGTIIRIERVSVETSNATWQIGLEMSELVNLFDRLFRLVQENKGGFDNVIKTFETQHNVSLYELLSAHNNHLLYWDNTTHTLTPTDFPKEDVVRCVNGLFFRISTTQAGIPYLEWSVNGSSDWHSSSTNWGTIGGNINNQTDLKNALDAKQGTISDLSTIRSGAAKGATAVQPNDDITVLNNNAGYITASYHDATKQDLLVDGTNIKTVNGNSLLGSGNITISSSVAWGNIQGTLTDQTDLNTALSGKANTDMNNLTGTGANISNWSSNVSNCITNILQDIKLELNNGTLTLKAGSKVYIPNGAGTFDELTIQSDVTKTQTTNESDMFFVMADGTVVTWDTNSNIVSGPTYNGGGLGVWYDTTNNRIRYTTDSGSTWSNNLSLPVCIYTVSGGAISSIDQIFNGFGYIGSTVFALPGVKGLIPNGRNADGSLKNTTTNDFTTVKTVQVTTSTAKIAMYSGGGLGSQTKNFGLNEPENYNYDSGILTNALEVARVIVDSNAKITSFTPKTAFHAVDYSDTEYMAHQAMPSSRYSNVTTIGASGTSYQAPADGYFFAAITTAGTGNVTFANQNGSGFTTSLEFSTTGYTEYCFIPVAKGDSVALYFNNATVTRIRFIYANGAQ